MQDYPFLSKYDPSSTGEGSLDPLGLYLIADQLAQMLVPAVRERMQRIRFLTPMVVGALVTEGLAANPKYPQISPYLVWEWLVVEAIVRTHSDDDDLWGVPGTLVCGRACKKYGYVDYQSYLKTPQVFGFHGVYKRLAVRLGFLDIYLHIHEKQSEQLLSAWAKDQDLGHFDSSLGLYKKWRGAVERSLEQNPVRTKPFFSKADWQQMAACFVPDRAGSREKKVLRNNLLQPSSEKSLHALPRIWEIIEEDGDEVDSEKYYHQILRTRAREYALLVDAIGAYELFCRTISDAFDIVRYLGSKSDARGYLLSDANKEEDLSNLAAKLPDRYRTAVTELSELNKDVDFTDRFVRFSEPHSAEVLAKELCDHHEAIQRDKSKEGKRPWFDRLGTDRIYMRQNYRVMDYPSISDNYVHQYRTAPIRKFYNDLT